MKCDLEGGADFLPMGSCQASSEGEFVKEFGLAGPGARVLVARAEKD